MKDIFRAGDPFDALALRRLQTRMIPSEFQGGSDTSFWSDGGPDTPRGAQELIDLAKERLARHLVIGGSSDKAESPDCYQFQMKHNYVLTQEMAAAGWVQWQATVQTRSDQECSDAGVKRKRFRYAVHFWQGPAGDLVLGKVKMQGKHTPCVLTTS